MKDLRPGDPLKLSADEVDFGRFTDDKQVELVAFAGSREVYGFNNLVDGSLPTTN